MNSSSSRPLGVTAAALFFLALALAALAIATRYILNPAGNQEMILLFTRLKLPVTYLNLLAVPALLTAGLAGLLFRGLWEKLPWARVATIFFSFIVMLMALAAIAFFMVFQWGGKRSIWLAADVFVIFTFIFIYFIKVRWDAADETPDESLSVQQAIPAPAPPPPPSIVAPAAPVGNPTLRSAPTVVTPAAAATAADTVRVDAPGIAKVEPLACLTIISGPQKGKRFEITRENTLVGRHPDLADIHLDDLTVSARHAYILQREGRFILKDLESTNGSFVNGQRVRGAHLNNQDVITLGTVDLQFTAPCASQDEAPDPHTTDTLL